jgi:regulator of nonsense transcripts 2
LNALLTLFLLFFRQRLSRVWPDIGETLLIELEQQFHGQAKFKKNQNIESRLRTARYIGELTKFRIAPPIVSLRCLRRCLDDFTGGNVDVACTMLESCGRYVHRLPHANARLNVVMETMVRLSKAKVCTPNRNSNVDFRLLIILSCLSF